MPVLDSHDLNFLNRPITRAIDLACTDTPVISLLGPRQCGKSTLAMTFDPSREYITLDDHNTYSNVLRDPQGFIDNLPEKVTIDEIQRIPQLFIAIKRSVDMNRKPGAFCSLVLPTSYKCLEWETHSQGVWNAYI